METFKNQHHMPDLLASGLYLGKQRKSYCGCMKKNTICVIWWNVIRWSCNTTHYIVRSDGNFKGQATLGKMSIRSVSFSEWKALVGCWDEVLSCCEKNSACGFLCVWQHHPNKKSAGFPEKSKCFQLEVSEVATQWSQSRLKKDTGCTSSHIHCSLFALQRLKGFDGLRGSQRFCNEEKVCMLLCFKSSNEKWV